MLDQQRVQNVISNMKTVGLKQILVGDDPSIFYLTGRFVNPMER